MLENCEVVKSNLNKPFHSEQYDSYSSSVGILLNDDLKEQILKLLKDSFAKEKGLEMALENFLEKKISVSEEGREIFYASVKWVNQNGTLKLSRPLPVDGLVEGQNFPYSFTGKLQLGFSFSLQFTFSCYLNGVVVEDVISQESNFTGFTARSSFNPSVQAAEEKTIEEEIEELKKEAEEEKKEAEEEKKETFLDKAKKKKFW